MIKRYLRETA